MALIKQTVAEKRTSLPAEQAAARQASDGNGLLSSGYSMVDLGQGTQGIAAMQAGLAKGGLASPEEGRLHLALAYLSLGDKADALRALRTIGGTGPTAQLASLWMLHIGSA